MDYDEDIMLNLKEQRRIDSSHGLEQLTHKWGRRTHLKITNLCRRTGAQEGTGWVWRGGARSFSAKM